jgi:hypothetical protein
VRRVKLKMGKKKEFDYYIFIDYSENFVGYSIIEKSKLKEIVPKISRFRHYRESRNKCLYLKNIKNTVKRENLFSYFFKIKIKETRHNLEIYSDVLNFLKNHNNCLVFVSVDNHEYSNFVKLVTIIDGDKTEVKKESELKKDSPEYKVSLVLDNLLNIERLKDGCK